MTTGRKILIVDDDTDVRKLVRLSLEIEGFEVVDAADARDASSKIARERPDLIILDLMMPDLSGWDLLALLQEDGATQKIPVVILSAKALKEDREYGQAHGVTSYITKPFDPVDLVKKIKDIWQEQEDLT